MLSPSKPIVKTAILSLLNTFSFRRRTIITKWIQKFHLTVSAAKDKPRERMHLVRTPEYAERVRTAALLIISPKRSAIRNSLALNLLD